MAAQFETAGLKPTVGSSYFQPVEFTETSLDAAKSTLALVVNGVVKQIAVPGEAQLGYSADSAPNIQAAVVLCRLWPGDSRGSSRRSERFCR